MVAGAAPLPPARREHRATGLSSAGRPFRTICGLRPIIEHQVRPLAVTRRRAQSSSLAADGRPRMG